MYQDEPMPNLSTGPLIPVKKFDGTTVRMTTAEFRAYQRGMQQQPATPAPASSGSLDELIQHVETEFQIPKELQDRLRSLIQSRIRDVRTDEQFLGLAMSPRDRSGFGLTISDAESLLALVKKTVGMKDASASKRATQETWHPAGNLSVKELPPAPASSMIEAARGTSPTSPEISIHNGPPQEVMPSQTPSLGARMARSQEPQERRVIHDVTMPLKDSKRSVGPMEEFANFSLADFRRLGATPDAAVSRLKEKFDILKAESYLLFLQAKDAWFGSPVFQEYTDAIRSALSAGQRLSETLASVRTQNRMTMDVFLGIARVNKYLQM